MEKSENSKEAFHPFLLLSFFPTINTLITQTIDPNNKKSVSSISSSCLMLVNISYCDDIHFYAILCCDEYLEFTGITGILR